MRRAEAGSPPGSAAEPFGEELSDEELCGIIRQGEAWPLATLWNRHRPVAQSWAARRDPDAAEEVVAEAFSLIFEALVDGGGPTESFRGYLYKTMDSLLLKRWRARGRTSDLEDLDDLAGDEPELSAVSSLGEREEQYAAAVALRELPERWRQIIIAVDVEGKPVQEVAGSLGLTPNSTSVLLKRAREGLRKAWMQRMHSPAAALPEECAGAVKHFGIMRWGKKGTRRRKTAEQHLDTCEACRSRYAQFIERAASLGLGLAAALALTREWRDKLVPALATSAAVVASFSVTTAFDEPLFAPPPPAEVAEADDSRPASPVQQDPPARGMGGSSLDDGEPEDPQEGGGDEDEDPQKESEEDDSDDDSGDDDEDDDTGEPEEDAPRHLYFGDWSGWDSAGEVFRDRQGRRAAPLPGTARTTATTSDPAGAPARPRR